MNNAPAPWPAHEDPAVEALRTVASRRTVQSVKQTILTVILIRAVRGQQPRWHNRLVLPAAVLVTASSLHLHIWQYLIHFLH
jgi:hypothetical protein